MGKGKRSSVGSSDEVNQARGEHEHKQSVEGKDESSSCKESKEGSNLSTTEETRNSMCTKSHVHW